jgi:hypothetical protein
MVEDYSRFEEAGAFDPGAPFTREFELHDTTLTIYAIDLNGANFYDVRVFNVL